MLAFQSTPPVWGATGAGQAYPGAGGISIHAPRVGGDTCWTHCPPPILYFNPRPPCGGRPSQPGQNAPQKPFQSTPPVWGATICMSLCYIKVYISIHAPRVGGDERCLTLPGSGMLFQSTPPVWGATGRTWAMSPRPGNFNPRPPCGGRRWSDWSTSSSLYFNPRPPCGGRRVQSSGPASAFPISIHAPRVGGDRYDSQLPFRHWLFQSTPPVWGATRSTSHAL